MAGRKVSTSSAYAQRILTAIARNTAREHQIKYPVDIGEVVKVGTDDEDIVINMANSLADLSGDAVQWMIDEEKLRVGDIVTVVYDKVGDPMVVAAVFDADLKAGLESPISTQIAASHTHREEVHIPTSTQSNFTCATGFDSANVYVDGARLLEGLHYTVVSPVVYLASYVLPSTIVQIDLRLDS